jgi:inorganic pyrophosphatase/exopolyphosphatase
MISCYTFSGMHRFSISLVTAMKPKVKSMYYAALMLSYVLSKSHIFKEPIQPITENLGVLCQYAE